MLNKYHSYPLQDFPRQSSLTSGTTLLTWGGRRIPEPESTFPIDIQVDNESVVVHAELPGLSTKDIKVEIGENILLIESQVDDKVEVEKESNGYTLQERHFGAMRRRIKLPYDVDSESTTSTYKDGILEIILPIASRAKVKVIEVK